MNEQEDMGVSLLEENKLFVVYDYESGRKENYSGGGEKVFIIHCLNKFVEGLLVLNILFQSCQTLFRQNPKGLSKLK